MRTKPIFNFKDIDFSNAEGNAQEINVKPTATAPAELQTYSHLKVIPYSSTQYQVVKAKLKAGGATQTPTTQTLINISDVTIVPKGEHKGEHKAAATHSNAHGQYGGGERRRERRLQEEQQQGQYGQPGYGQGQYGQQGSAAYQQQIAAEMAQQQMGQQYMDPYGTSESYGYAEGGSSKTPVWAKLLFIPGAILGGVLAHHLSKGKTLEGKAKYLHYGLYAFGGALAFNLPQIYFEAKPLFAKKVA